MDIELKTYDDFINFFIADSGRELFKKAKFSDLEAGLDEYISALFSLDKINSDVRLKERFYSKHLPGLIVNHLFVKRADDAGCQRWIIELPKLVKGVPFTADVKSMDHLSHYLLMSLRNKVPLVGIISELAQAIDAFVAAHPEFEMPLYD